MFGIPKPYVKFWWPLFHIFIIINSIKDDIWDMNELFHKLTNFGEQSSKPCWQKKRKEDFHFLLIQKNSPQQWIVKDGDFCKSYGQAGFGIVQFCNIVLLMVSSIGILGVWRSVLKIHFFH